MQVCRKQKQTFFRSIFSDFWLKNKKAQIPVNTCNERRARAFTLALTWSCILHQLLFFSKDSSRTKLCERAWAGTPDPGERTAVISRVLPLRTPHGRSESLHSRLLTASLYNEAGNEMGSGDAELRYIVGAVAVSLVTLQVKGAIRERRGKIRSF